MWLPTHAARILLYEHSTVWTLLAQALDELGRFRVSRSLTVQCFWTRVFKLSGCILCSQLVATHAHSCATCACSQLDHLFEAFLLSCAACQNLILWVLID